MSAYSFRVGEHVRQDPEACDPADKNQLFGVVKELGPPTGMFGNYGVRVKWLNMTPKGRAKQKDEWYDDLDLVPIPAVDLIARLGSTTVSSTPRQERR